jgi:hypothetical protein
LLYPVQLRDFKGRKYPHFVQDISVRWYAFPANYAFARLVPDIGGGGSCIILYLGEAEDMSTRMRRHERLREAMADHGATHTLYHPNFVGVEARRAVERDLIDFYNPVMNVQHRTGTLTAIDGRVAPRNSCQEWPAAAFAHARPHHQLGQIQAFTGLDYLPALGDIGSPAARGRATWPARSLPFAVHATVSFTIGALLPGSAQNAPIQRERLTRLSELRIAR